MPTCASKIMLTSLAPSPTARVMGCSLEALISFTICRKTQRKMKLRATVCHSELFQSCFLREVRPSHLSLLQRRHATAQHGAAVAADLQKNVFVVAGTSPLLVGLQHCRQSGPVDNQTEIQAVDRQPATKFHQSVQSFSNRRFSTSQNTACFPLDSILKVPHHTCL